VRTPEFKQKSSRTLMGWLWIGVIAGLLVLRLPSLVQPAGGDQGLYVYAAQRILAGDVMYRDVWDQKPPGVAFLYAPLSAVWRGEAVVPGADLAAAAATAVLLVLLGRRRYSLNVGCGAATAFLVLGDPYLLRLSGIYVRGQCEPFIALAITAGLTLLAHRGRRPLHLLGAGVALAAAFWLKYNAATYALPIVVATWAWRSDGAGNRRSFVGDLVWVASGFMAVTATFLLYFTLTGALIDLRLATIDYNLQYSNETYAGTFDAFAYVATMPLQRASADMLWFVAGVGSLLLAGRRPWGDSTLVVLSWVVAAVLSIAVNGSRGLPNYFVQANPALALVASAGLATLAGYRTGVRFATVALLVAALWRVGTDAPYRGFRLASMPGLIANVGFDLRHIAGQVDRATYLRRFKGVKHDALENDELARYIRETTRPGEDIFVFGFSGGSVSWKSGRASASRFFWSRPVFIEFAADRPGYGSAGLLEDLRRRPPTIVALQKEEWRSRDFFLANEPLRGWLTEHYLADRETPMFSVWRRKP